MLEMRRAQLSFGDGLIAEEVSDLRDNWMEAADRVLADEEIVTAVYEALDQRHLRTLPQDLARRALSCGVSKEALPRAR